MNPSDAPATTTTSFDAGLAYLDEDSNRPPATERVEDSTASRGPEDESTSAHLDRPTGRKPAPLKKKKLAMEDKKEDKKEGSPPSDTQFDAKPSASLPIQPRPLAASASPPQSPPDDRIVPGSPHSTSNAFGPSSPRHRLRSTSPRVHSPASSQIFERNVQESVDPEDMPRAIPSHIQTEDHIPPVLEASSLAITDDHLNPDEVEIVMHSAHQPAAASVAAGTDSLHSALSASLHSATHSPLPDDAPSLDSLPPTSPSPDSSDASPLDAADPRRLSFISFADLLQAEHIETASSASPNRESLFLPLHASPLPNRSPSPVPRSRTSLSSAPPASPPTSGAASVKGLEISGARSPPRPLVLGSPGQSAAGGAQSPPLSGDLMVETMSQALRRTGSGDLRDGGMGGLGGRSAPVSAVTLEDAGADDRLFR
ncbi:hypothetical protein P152DRAFT_168688 [Eremomyces bilateralis CBS 781.70]|uniref:Uncharacterized protein n=1 Tax=Eremomyces bilateralis CBS 781.70 TaxID=1392243 RepID=A0A6G1FU88_9PEZI|nr:uncharacterized protein P152DRAFT_168688 [Eremomyces bilateralis CBS 781.70]KAF1809310.1 hypothetical protein P152DRAFT_168688 [Eremomyces bilateralis CBS 781.70]